MSEKFLKLTNTVYKILEFFPESDPLKHRAKDRALAIMEHLILLNENKRLPDGRQGWATLADAFSEGKIRAQILEDIDVLLGYLWIGKSQGWLNSMNCLIIANEYEKVKKEIEPIIELTQKLPGMEEELRPKESTQIIPNAVLDNIVAKEEGISGNLVDISDRQGKIIEFMSKREKTQVMDLQTIFPDITKRTIRRDLDELLEADKIVRLGDFNQIFYQIKG